MAKVISKYQVKVSAGKATAEDRDSKLRSFDEATERHRGRLSASKTTRTRNRGWVRADLYERGRSR